MFSRILLLASLILTGSQIVPQVTSSSDDCCPEGSNNVNGMCQWLVAPTLRYICENDKDILTADNVCTSSYEYQNGVPCMEGYVLDEVKQICIRRYDARQEYCPEGYGLNSERMCEKLTTPNCFPEPSGQAEPSVPAEPSPQHPYDPLPTFYEMPCNCSSVQVAITASGLGSSTNTVYYVTVNPTVEAGYCKYIAAVNAYAICDQGTLNIDTKSCWEYYVHGDKSVPCQSGYNSSSMNGQMICLKQYPVRSAPCPTGFDPEDTSTSRNCIMKIRPTCTPTPSASMLTESVTRSQSGKPIEPSRTAAVTPSPSQKAAEPSRTAAVTPSPSQKAAEPSRTAAVTPSSSRSQSGKPAETTGCTAVCPMGWMYIQPMDRCVLVLRDRPVSNTPVCGSSNYMYDWSTHMCLLMTSDACIAPARLQEDGKCLAPVPTAPAWSCLGFLDSGASLYSTAMGMPLSSSRCTWDIQNDYCRIVCHAKIPCSPTPNPSSSASTSASPSSSRTATASYKPVDPSRTPTATATATATPTPTPTPTPTATVSRSQSGNPVYHSVTPRPSNVDVLDYTNRPNEPLVTNKPTCDIWICPEGYDIFNQNGKVVCRYYKLADYNIVDLPDTPEGQSGSSYADYFCSTGMKMVSVKTSKDPTVRPTYYCEAYTNARFLYCPTASRKPFFASPFPSLIYKSRVATASRKPLFFKGSLEFVGADINAFTNPTVLKKLIYALSCTVKDSPKSISIKSILHKVGTRVQTIPFVIPEVGDASIVCETSPKTSASVNIARRMQTAQDQSIEVVYSYQAADETYTPPTEVSVTSLLTEVAVDVSLTNESSSMVAFSLTSDPTIGGGGNQVANNNPSPAPTNTGALVGGILSAGIGAAIVAAAITYQVVKRRRKQSVTKVVKNPTTVVDIMDTRWASQPIMV
jgi:hypothetical protein